MAGIRVRYKPILGLFVLLAGLLVLLFGLVLETGVLLLIGALNTAAGIGYLMQPWFIVYGDRVELRNPLGMTLKTHMFDSLAEIEIRGGKLCRRGEARPMKRLGGWFARGTDLELVAAAIEDARRAESK
jgi:hypothetical protein